MVLLSVTVAASAGWPSQRQRRHEIQAFGGAPPEWGKAVAVTMAGLAAGVLAVALWVGVQVAGRAWEPPVAGAPIGPELVVYPRPPDLPCMPVPDRLPPRIGMHVGRDLGAGAESAGVRDYVPGDPLRDIHWPSSARTGRLHITEHPAERGADVILAVDAFSDVRSSLERSVRGAAGVARRSLRAGDRVGLVILGGGLVWLRLDTGARTYYRILDAVLGLRRDDSFVTPELARLPPPALPAAAMVLAFTPLLDDRTLIILRDMCHRCATVLVVDVLTARPALPRRASHQDELALRLWQLDRAAEQVRLSEHGARVVSWGAGQDLGEVLSSARRGGDRR